MKDVITYDMVQQITNAMKFDFNQLCKIEIEKIIDVLSNFLFVYGEAQGDELYDMVKKSIGYDKVEELQILKKIGYINEINR